MNAQVMVYEIKSSASKNAEELFHSNGNYFYWNQAKFNNLNIGDWVFVVNKHSNYVLFTKLRAKDIFISFNEENNTTSFQHDKEDFSVSGKWDDFVCLEIIDKLETPSDWQWKSFGSSETTYLNGDRVNPKASENRILNINQLEGLSNETAYQDVLKDCLINFNVKSEGFSAELFKFIDQAQTDNLKYSHYKKSFSKTKVKVSFGQGTPAKIAWISFLIEPNKTSDGIYPVYLYFKDINKLILAYGLSETKKPSTSWNLKTPKSIIEFFNESSHGKPYRYGSSFIFKVYDVNNIKNEKSLDSDLNEIIKIYKDRLNQDKEENIYTWVKTHKGIVNFLKDKQDSQKNLIELLKEVGCDIFNDQNPDNNIIPLDEIDPFTFFCYINKYGKKRLEILKNLAINIGASIPTDDSGIPSANPQKVWLFPYKYMRKNKEVERLWDFFHSTSSHAIKDDEFEDILTIRGVAHAKITEAMFYIDPENYFPINGPTKPYLSEVFGINPSFETFSEYDNILSQIRSKSDKPFYQISHEAWFWNDSQKNSNNDFIESINSFTQEELRFYFHYLDEIVKFLELKQGDKRVVYSCKGPYLNLNIGQRIAWRLDTRAGKRYHVITDKIVDDNSERFDGEPEHYYNVFNEENQLNIFKQSSLPACEKELDRTTKSSYKRHNNVDFERAVFDKIFRKQFIKTETMEKNNTVLNKILFGPPGTGKTFNTINESLQIVDPEFYDSNLDNRDFLNKRFKELLIKNWEDTNGQIAFCTFHQSFSYEDFVEGIKPKVNDKKEVYYEIEDGIFKKICQLADSSISAVKMAQEGKLSLGQEEYEAAVFYKLSLGDSKKTEDKEIYEYCRDNDCIALGFGEGLDFTGMNESEIIEFCKDSEELGDIRSSAPLNYFIHYINEGDYVLISNGNKFVRALGRVIGEYEFDDSTPIRYNQFRKVEWIFKDENIPVEELYNRGFSQQTLYKIDKNGLKREFFVNHGEFMNYESKKVKDYVLVIDEINRGNVSSIFGELITLIEPDKRAGRKEELEVTLPYSARPFKVPHNVYIVGTMNTADRSIEALDTALRRRFSFDEKPPKPELIETEGKSGKTKGVVDGINLKKLLEAINNRIEKLIDKDHKIGHSYFLKVHDKKSLVSCFENEVIPLLEEYFFGDYGKIGLILGDTFVTKDNSDDFDFADFEGYDSDVSSDLKEKSVYKINATGKWDFNKI